MSNRDGDFGSFFSGLLMGGVIGAAVALLMAPQSGEATRKLIRDRSLELRDQGVDALEKAATEARTRADELTKLAREQANELRGRAEQWRTKGEAAVQDLRGQAETLLKKGETAVEDLRLRGEAAVEAAKAPRGGRAADNDDGNKKKS